jgi:hypothetical protein
MYLNILEKYTHTKYILYFLFLFIYDSIYLLFWAHIYTYKTIQKLFFDIKNVETLK